MSDYQPKPGRGNAFKNTKSDNKAAYSGNVCLPDGTMAFIDLYAATDRDTGEKRKDKNGNPWLNVVIKPMDKQPSGGGGYQEQTESGERKDPFEDDPDSIPFICRNTVW